MNLKRTRLPEPVGSRGSRPSRTTELVLPRSTYQKLPPVSIVKPARGLVLKSASDQLVKLPVVPRVAEKTASGSAAKSPTRPSLRGAPWGIFLADDSLGTEPKVTAEPKPKNGELGVGAPEPVADKLEAAS